MQWRTAGWRAWWSGSSRQAYRADWPQCRGQRDWQHSCVNSGAGLVVLNGANACAGATTLTNSTTGVVRLGVDNALPTTTALQFGIGTNAAVVAWSQRPQPDGRLAGRHQYGHRQRHLQYFLQRGDPHHQRQRHDDRQQRHRRADQRGNCDPPRWREQQRFADPRVDKHGYADTWRGHVDTVNEWPTPRPSLTRVL